MKLTRNIFVLICVVVIFAVVHGNATSTRLKRSIQACGVPKRISGLIIGGQNFSRDRFPWIVALMSMATEPPSFFCAGTLISSTYVVSAAHCIRGKESTKDTLPGEVLALFGAHNLSNCFETGRYALSPRKIIKHDEWNPLTTEYDGDVSLLEFERENIHFNTFVQPICLWNSKIEPTVTSGTVTGWGKSEDPYKKHETVPRLITVQIQRNEQCLPKHGRLAEISSERTFCAGLLGGSGVCHGDSGGGLFIEVNNIYYLKGIVSSSLIKADGCDVSNNAVYTNVLKFREWIAEKTGDVLESSTQALRKLFCTFEIMQSNCCGLINTCTVNGAIESEDFVLGSEFITTVEQFHISNKPEVKFLPREIGDRFPNLIEFKVRDCGLTIMRNHYFKDMGKLYWLNLSNNKISTIEPDSFKDLVSVKWLYLGRNMIVTLDEKLFATMLNLQEVYLDRNKIKFLSPTVFKIPDGKLNYVHLEGNVCIDGVYWFNWHQIEADIRANCTQ